MNYLKTIFCTLMIVSLFNCKEDNNLKIQVFETSANGNKLTQLDDFNTTEAEIELKLLPEETFQTITGFGGSFTESSAYLLNNLSIENRNKIIEAYFGDSGAKYSLTRTHINSCDFSLSNYSYAPTPDKELKDFSIKEDKDDIIPMIKDAMKTSSEGFKIISSPWTSPPWMKDNNSWVGGKLLPEYYDTWALFFSKYITAYKNEGIDIWGITIENEPLGNGNNWESMHFSPEETIDFANNYLGPQFEKDNHDVKILAYDQNRGHELETWAKAIYKDKNSSKYIDGMAIHWYGSTFNWFPESLQLTHKLAPNNHIINSEACVDAEVPKWQDDKWYWSKEATDWGYTWAPDEDKHHHPKYVPVYRYARNIIGSLNNHVDGWIDWNMVLDKQGGPNWFKNWCVAPVIVDPDKDEVYFTPLYYTLAHFSKFIRPNAKRIGFSSSNKDIMVTAAKNPDGSVAVILLNMTESPKSINIDLEGKYTTIQISAQAVQTVLIP